MNARVGLWSGTTTAVKLAMSGMAVTIVYGVVAGIGFSLGPSGAGASGWWWPVLSILQMTVPFLLVEILVTFGLRSHKPSSLHTLGVIGAGLVGLGAAGQGVMETVVVVANMVGGTVPTSVAPVITAAALVLALVGGLWLATAVVGWREARAQARRSSVSTTPRPT